MTSTESLPLLYDGYTTGSPALRYVVHETRSDAGPQHTIVLSHALGCDLSMWNALTDRLNETCRVIAYDHRGHGKSASAAGPYTMAELADDAARVIQQTAHAPVVWIGISMGGMVGQELALRYPSLISALVIANSTSHYPDEAQTAWQQRIITLEQQGIPGIAEAALQRFFSPSFREHHSAVVDTFRRRLLSTELQAYLGCCHAVRAVNTTDRLSRISAPVQIIGSELDQGTPVSMAKMMADALPNARLTVLPDAAHLSVVEQPEAFARTVTDFLREI